MLRRDDSSGDDRPQAAPGRDAVASTSAGSGGKILGPNCFVFKLPAIDKIESRNSSAVRRRILKRQNRSFVGSLAKALLLGVEDI